MAGVWREPNEESTGIYPGLVVCDDRVSGSITVGRSRLPVWAFIGEVIRHGYDSAEDYDAEDERHGSFSRDDAAAFISHLMEQRGEFGRLILLLADVERREAHGRGVPWWETKRNRKRMAAQLRRCLALVEDGA